MDNLCLESAIYLIESHSLQVLSLCSVWPDAVWTGNTGTVKIMLSKEFNSTCWPLSKKDGNMFQIFEIRILTHVAVKRLHSMLEGGFQVCITMPLKCS